MFFVLLRFSTWAEKGEKALHFVDWGGVLVMRAMAEWYNGGRGKILRTKRIVSFRIDGL